MRLAVKDPVEPVAIPDSYSVEIELMGGDADYYTSLELKGFERGRDEELLEDLLRLLERLKASYPYGRGGGDEFSYRLLKGFEPWFLEDDDEEYWRFEPSSEEEAQELRELSARVRELTERTTEKLPGSSSDPYWPHDATDLGFDGHGECGYRSHEVFYYDGNLVKHLVEVEL